MEFQFNSVSNTVSGGLLAKPVTPSNQDNFAGALATAYAAQDKAAAHPAPATDAKEEFLKIAKMTPAQRFRYLWLKQHNLTEEDLKAMSPQKRNQIEEQIRGELKRSIEQKVEQRLKNVGFFT